MIKWILSWHLIAMVAWFAGLFYLPRLFIYHRLSFDSISLERFKIMEHKLYYMITTPAAILTTFFGIWLLTLKWDYYEIQNWMHVKLILVLLLWIYHLSCGYFLQQFKQGTVKLSDRFFRWFNEIPTLLLMGIVIFAVVKPHIF